MLLEVFSMIFDRPNAGSILKGLAWVMCLGILLSCEMEPKSPVGFRLPDGDPARGKAIFIELQCYACHSVAGVDMPDSEEKPPDMVSLGGPVRRIKTYGQLVTSIINPSHELAKGYPIEKITVGDQSRMKNFNDVMTVTQLVHLVAFLQNEYEVIPDDTTYYYPYGPTPKLSLR